MPRPYVQTCGEHRDVVMLEGKYASCFKYIGFRERLNFFSIMAVLFEVFAESSHTHSYIYA